VIGQLYSVYDTDNDNLEPKTDKDREACAFSVEYEAYADCDEVERRVYEYIDV
jgi:hypothetical protein